MAAVLDDVLTLVGESYEKDATGVERPQKASRQIYCRVGSITRAEFAAAGRNGLNPELVFTVFAADYADERTILYNGQGYGVYRTYHVPATDYLELYVQRKGGTNGAGRA